MRVAHIPMPLANQQATDGMPLTSSSRSIGKILNSDIEDEIKYWSSAIVCYVTSSNGILFDKKPFIVTPWFPKISYAKASLLTVPVWVKLPKLDVRYWSETALHSIAGYLGKVLKIDQETLTKSRLMYAHVLVYMNKSEGFLEELFYSNEHDELIAQQV